MYYSSTALMDTIQIVQTLRNCLPAPHIPVSSWKSESEGTVGVGVGVGVGVPQGMGMNTLGLQSNRTDNLH